MANFVRDDFSTAEGAAMLGITESDFYRIRALGVRLSSRADVEKVLKKSRPTIADEAAQVGIEIQRKTFFELASLRKLFFIFFGAALGYLSIALLLVLAFIAFPTGVAEWLGYIQKRPAIADPADAANKDSVIIESYASTGNSSLIPAVLKPASSISLEILKVVNPNKYVEIEKQTILDPNQVLALSEQGDITPLSAINIENSSLLKVGDSELVSNLNSEYLQGRKPGTQVGDIAIVGMTPGFSAQGDIAGAATEESVETPDGVGDVSGPVLAAGTYGGEQNIPTIIIDATGTIVGLNTSPVSGLDSNNLAQDAGITNGQLANSGINVSADTGSGTINLGETLSFAGTGTTTIEAVGNNLVFNSVEADTAQSVYERGNSVTTASGGDVNYILDGGLAVPTSFNIVNEGSADSLVISNAADAGSGIHIDQTGGILGSAITVSQSSGTMTNGITFDGLIGVDITTSAARALNIDSGTTGDVLIGTGNFAKAITLGNNTGTTALNLNSGLGNINLQVAGNGVTGNVQIGEGSGTPTPDLLVLDNKNSAGDPAGVNGAMYYNSSLNKFRCFENSAWTDCVKDPGSMQHVSNYDTNEAMTNIPTGGAQVTLGNIVITPASATGDVYVAGWADVYSSNGTDQPLEIAIETTADCTGTVVGNASVTYTITSGGSTANDRGSLRVSGVVVNPGAAAQNYSLCARVVSGGGDTDVMYWGIEAIVVDTGADLAELYSTLDNTIEAGDVVALDETLAAGVEKAGKVSDRTVVGVVATRPGLLIGEVESAEMSAVPVALKGRIPVKVSTENGNIYPGDYLSSSTIPGVAMKAGKGSVVIGIAMSGYSTAGEVGKVLMFASLRHVSSEVKTGRAVIPAHELTVEVQEESVNEDSRILLTASEFVMTRVKSVRPGEGFVIEISTAKDKEVKVDYLIE